MVSPTQNFGGKCLTSGKHQHFCLGRRFSKQKMTRYSMLKFVAHGHLGSPWLKFVAHGHLGSPWLRLWVLHCLFFMRILTLTHFLHDLMNIYLFHQKWY